MNLMNNANKQQHDVAVKLLNILLLSLFLIAIPQLKAATVQLKINPINNMISGKLRDGTLLAVAQVNYSGSHCGFKISMAGNHVDGTATDYILSNSLSNQSLTVRLVPQGNLRYQQKDGQLVVMDKNSLYVKIVANGNQLVGASLWPLTLNATPLSCNSS